MPLFSRLIAAFVLMLGITGAGLAQDPSPTRQLLEASGLDTVFKGYGEGIAEGIVTEGITDKRFLAAWADAAATSFDPPVLIELLESALASAIDAAQREELLAFYQSPLGIKIVGYEKAGNDLEPAQQAKAVVDGLSILDELDDASARRRQLADIFSLSGAEVAPELVRQSSRAMMLGLALSGGANASELPWDAIDAQIEAMMPAIKAELTSYLEALSASLYAPLSDDELDDYIAFLRTDAARDFIDTGNAALKQILAAAMAQFGETLGRRLTQQGA